MDKNNDDENKPCGCGIGIPVPPEVFKEVMSKMSGQNPMPTVPAHYGVTNEQYDKIMKEILCDMIKNNEKTATIDKFFPRLSAEDRVKVLAYSEALNKLKKIYDVGD